MSNYGAVAQIPKIRSTRSSLIKKKMKLTIKQKIRNWLMNDDYETDFSSNAISIEDCQNLSSEGFKLQVYKANGGIIVETRNYDRRRDENRNSLYVVTEDKDLGAEIGKIITMENLKG
jgi:hypothetical protein